MADFETLGGKLHSILNSDYLPRKTKIVCTMGPAIWDRLDEAIDSGMNVARLNFSHGDHTSHGKVVERLREALSRKSGVHVGILLDTKGPEIRTGFLQDSKAVQLVKDQLLEITTDYKFKGTSKKIACSYEKLPKSVTVGSKILAADGSLSMEVADIKESSVIVKMLNSGSLGERKNMNLPGVKVDFPTITEKDRKDLIDFGLKYMVDFIAASFVQSGEDIDTIRKVLGEKGRNIKIIAKIENEEGLHNFDDILRKADGIMVARGDLGMEIPMSKVFLAQKMMIKKCNLAGKLVVTATQMLESMTSNPRPTRAEATDVANAILDGSDAVMLSGETAGGSYPIEAIRTMSDICKEAESAINYTKAYKTFVETIDLNDKLDPISPMEFMISAAVKLSLEINARILLVMSQTGTTPRVLAKYKPKASIMLLTQSNEVARQSMLTRGVFPIVYKAGNLKKEQEVEFALEKGSTFAREFGWIAPNDLVVAIHSWKFQVYKTLTKPNENGIGCLGTIENW